MDNFEYKMDAEKTIKKLKERVVELEELLKTTESLNYKHWSALQATPQTKPHPKCDKACMYLCQLNDESLIEELKKRFGEDTVILRKPISLSTPQTKPRLSDEEIKELALKVWILSPDELTEEYAQDYVNDVIEFARAIEERILGK